MIPIRPVGAPAPLPPAPVTALTTLAPIAAVAIGLGAAALTGSPAPALLSVLIGVVITWRVSGGGRHGWRALGFVRPVSPGRTLAIGAMIAGLLHGVLSLVLLPWLTRVVGAPDLSAFNAIFGRPELLAVMLAIALINGAFAEEIVFRGFLLRRLERHFGADRRAAVASLIVSSILFGLAHFYQGVTGIVGTTVAGAAFGAAMLVDRRVLWAAVIAHGLYDWSSLALLYLEGAPATT
jgi:membrane protease YdiL (CAAX protease family)